VEKKNSFSYIAFNVRVLISRHDLARKHLMQKWTFIHRNSSPHIFQVSPLVYFYIMVLLLFFCFSHSILLHVSYLSFKYEPQLHDILHFFIRVYSLNDVRLDIHPAHLLILTCSFPPSSIQGAKGYYANSFSGPQTPIRGSFVCCVVLRIEILSLLRLQMSINL
jgi:hypothetical protein